MTQIIGFSAKKQGGKNTSANAVASVILNQLGFNGATVNNNGKLIVPASMPDGSISSGILDLQKLDNNLIRFLSEEIWPHVKLYSFADSLKEFCIRLFGLTLDQCYGSDEQKNSLTSLKWEDMPSVTTTGIKGKKYQDWETIRIFGHHFIYHIPGFMTAREVLQFFGTNICRKMFANCWTNDTINKILADGSAIAIITDVRFINEVEAIESANGIVIRLLRSLLDDDIHESEIILDKYNFKYYIDNTKLTIEESCSAVINKLTELGILHAN